MATFDDQLSIKLEEYITTKHSRNICLEPSSDLRNKWHRTHIHVSVNHSGSKHIP